MAIAGFDPSSYLAANPDLLRAGYTTNTAESHYTSYGIREGRSTTFDSASYLAANTDLIQAGVTTTTATQHYISYGYRESRSTTFDSASYLASYSDLIQAGVTTTTAAQHYISYGYRESRTISFSASSYMAANSDLNFHSAAEATSHYLSYGWRESRTTTFDFSSVDVSDYMSSYVDLQSAFSSTEDRDSRALEHYRTIGIFEGRRVTPRTTNVTAQPTTSLTPTGTLQSASLSVAGERDLYAITMTAGTPYTIAMNGSATSSGTLRDPYLRLYDSRNQLITQDDDSGDGLNAQLIYTPTRSGTYYVSAGAFADSGTGTYLLSVTSPTVTPLPTSSGFISYSGERDDFTYTLSGGSQYRIDLQGSATGAGTLGDPYLRVFDGLGTQLRYDDDSGEGYDSQIFFTPTSTGIYTLQASGFGSSTGSYTLSVTQLS